MQSLSVEGTLRSKERFAWHVKHALANFYDHVHLQASPLAELLQSGDVSKEDVGASLRQTLRETIDSLRPAAELPVNRPEWLGYRILWLRYIQSLSQVEICKELALSRATFYRRHQEGLDAVVSILWRQYQERQTIIAKETGRVALSSDDRTREEVVQLAQTEHRQSMDVSELIDGVRQTIAPLARQQGIEVRIDALGALSAIYADPSTLRQIILNVLTEGINLRTEDILQLVVTQGDQETIWELRGLDASRISEADLRRKTGFVVSQGLLDVYGARLWLEKDKDDAPVLVFTLPTAKPKSILIIDDNPDTIDLYNRYLRGHDYVVLVACNVEEVERLLSEITPDLILLDVLIPGYDGWLILQRLKTRPETANVRVVVCSVLGQPQLALALGAAQVLRKPISKGMLLKTVRTVLAQASNEA